MRTLLALALLCLSIGPAFTDDSKNQVTQGKLDSIIIPEINLQNVKLGEALTTLGQLSVASDAKSEASKGVNIILKSVEKKGEPVTLTMKNVTVGEIAQAIAKQCNLKVVTEAYAIAFVPNNP